MQNFPLNSTASLLLAAAGCELFPDTQILGGRGTEKYFYADFVFPFEFKNDFLPLIEERMRLILREKRGVRSTEMMPANAAALMQHRRQNLLAGRLLNMHQSTVPVAQIGDFILPFAQAEDLSIPHLKILECQPLGQNKAIRIIGAAATDKETLKTIAKQPFPASRSHQKLASETALFCPSEEEGLWIWQPKGEQVKHQLLNVWREEMTKQNFSFISCPVPATLHAHKNYFERFGTPKLAEWAWIFNEEFNDPNDGLLSPKAFFSDRAHIFSTEEKLLEDSISSLRFILKIPKILGFEFEIVLSVSNGGAQKKKAKKSAILRLALEEEGLDYSVENQCRFGELASIDIRFADSLGRKWTGPTLSLPNDADGSDVLAISAFGPLERMCALLLEKNEGWLPFWLAPEQVRILTVGDQKGPFADEVERVLKARGLRLAKEAGKDKLNARLYQAVLEKVPYVLLLGANEEKTKTISLRAYGESDEKRLTLDEFCESLEKE